MTDDNLDFKGTTKKGHSKKFFMILAIAEAILLAACVIFFCVKELTGTWSTFGTADGAQIDSEDDFGLDISQPVKSEKKVNLKERIQTIDPEQIAPFTATIEDKFGYEYLCFSYDNIQIYYRNEYIVDDPSPRMNVLIDNGVKLSEFDWPFDLNKDLSQLCPAYGQYFSEAGNQLFFRTYTTDDMTGLPGTMRFLNADNLLEWDLIDVETLLGNLFKVELAEILPDESNTAAKRLSLTVNKIPYIYDIKEETYTNIVYNDETLNYHKESKMEITDHGIRLTAVVTASEEEYLGEATASLVLENGVPKLGDFKFGAYVQANQEDPDLEGIIRPANQVTGDRVTIMGRQGERFIIPKLKNIRMNVYDWTKLDTSDSNNWVLKDETGGTPSIRGIDVSKYQGEIEWEKVKEAGIKFAIIRLGFRGMGEGTLELDPLYEQNIKGANKAGVSAGVYFFSQALNEKEAVEEAKMVLENIKDYEIDYPVIFDTEYVISTDARANNLSRQERTNISIAFCETIKKAGYTPMIYANTKYMIMGLDLTQLQDYDMWFAYYGKNMMFPYDFQMFQYSESGRIPGIKAPVDLNISFVDYAAQ